jgi:DNA-binding NarL/FixJ family response regulator
MLETIPTVRRCAEPPVVDLPTVAVISPDGSLPPSMTPFRPRVATTDISAVEPSDDVVILHRRASAADLNRLRRTLGRQMPRVLITTPVLDERDIIGALNCGATGYLIVAETPNYCLVNAAVRTAAGESTLSPGVVQVMLRQLAGPAQPAPRPVRGGDLTQRERQIMELLVVGHTIAEIADHLHITRKTVRNNLSTIYAKLNVRRQSEAILLWLDRQNGTGTHLRHA